MAISAEFTADFSQFIDAAGSAEKAIGGVTEASATIGLDIEAQAAVAGRAIRDFGGQVTSFAKDYIGAFAEEEKATNRLKQALQETGDTSGAVIKNYQDMAATFQETTRYSDDAVLAAQTALTQIGRIAPEQMQPAIQAAADLASSLGIGLEEAAQKIATVIGSDGAKLGTLKKYLTDVEVKGKDASEIIAIFNSKFGGAAAADMETTEGKMTALNNRFDEFKGKVGEALATALLPLLDAFMSLDPTLQTIIAGGSALVIALTPIAIAFGSVLSAITPLIAYMGGWTAIWTAISAAVAGLAAPVAIVIAALGSLYLAWKYWDQIVEIAQGVYEGVKFWLLDKFTALAELILLPIKKVYQGFAWLKDQVVGHSVVPDMIDGIANQFDRLQEVMVDPARAAAEDANAAFGSVQLPGSSVGGPRGARFLQSPTGQRVPISDTGSLPDNWFDVYSGKSNFADVISDLGRPGGINNVFNITQPLGDPAAIARAVEDAMNRSLRNGGVRLPSGA